MMRYKGFRLGVLILPIAMVIIAIILIQQSQSIVTPTHRDLWNSRGGKNYEMIVEVVALPQPIVAQALTIQDGKVVKNSIIGCDTPPSGEYPTSDCKTIRTYYSTMGIYTIEELFSDTDFGLSRTREALSRCHAVDMTTFQDFSNADAMFEMAKNCEADLQSQPFAMLSAVEYNPYYGYPMKITSTIPAALDGTDVITVKSFRLTE